MFPHPLPGPKPSMSRKDIEETTETARTELDLKNFRKNIPFLLQTQKKWVLNTVFFFVRLVKRVILCILVRGFRFTHHVPCSKHQGFLRVLVLSEAFILIHQISPKFLTSWLWKVSRRFWKTWLWGKNTGNNKVWENFPGGEISNLYISKWKTLIFSKASEPVGDLTF